MKLTFMLLNPEVEKYAIYREGFERIGTVVKAEPQEDGTPVWEAWRLHFFVTHPTMEGAALLLAEALEQAKWLS